MIWDELIDKDKVKLVIDRFFDWLTFDTHEAYYDKLWETGELIETSFPVAFFHGGWKVFYEDDQDAYSFDPLHSMDDAWKIVEKLYEQFDMRMTVENDPAYKYSVRFSKRGDNLMSGYGYSNISMADAICKAALRAYGVDIK